MSRTVLWHLELSHYSEKVRWAMDHKALPHVRRAPVPGLHVPVAMALTKRRRLPILEIDGRRIHDSTRILTVLEERVPDPPLFPADPAERERATRLEEFFDAEVAPRVRGFVFHYATRNPEHMVAAVVPRATGAKAACLRAAYAAAGPHIRDYYRTAPDAAGLRAAMDRLEDEIQPNGYLVGEAFSIADLAGAAMFTPLIGPPNRPFLPRALPPEVAALREELEARPGGEWVHAMYARHR